MINIKYIQCFFCKNFVPKKINFLFCEAFPGGIPEEILTGEHDHKNQYDGDNGIQFEPIED